MSQRGAYLAVYVALLFCTYLTVQISFLDLGSLNVSAALAIATIKALLVVLFFMHLRQSTSLTRVVALGGLFWLAILIGLTMADYGARAWGTYG